jgi:TRAP-type C4-dicarboxylate transport system substrate-binding protein
MKNSFRRISAGLAIVSAILLAGAANAADIKERSLKIAFVNIKEHPHGLGAQKFADIVAEKSGGKIKAKLFGGGTLGGDLAVVSSLQGGTVDMTMVVPGTVSCNIKEFSIFDFPLLFNSYEEADAVLDGPIGQRLLARLPEKGLIGLGYWDHG